MCVVCICRSSTGKLAKGGAKGAGWGSFAREVGNNAGTRASQPLPTPPLAAQPGRQVLMKESWRNFQAPGRGIFIIFALA